MIKAEEVDMDYYMPKKEEDIVAELQPNAALKTGDNPATKPAGSKSNNPLVEKFTQLWFACYFEKRLTRQRIESADLVSIIRDLTEYFTREGTKVDFRRAVPLLQGLHVLYIKKFALL